MKVCGIKRSSMDDTKRNSVDSAFPVNGGTDNGASEMKEEKQASHVTLHQKEVIEKDENGQLLPNVEEAEVLESVHKYAKRIKSFLGWEPYTEELGTETVESTDARVDRKSVSYVDRGDAETGPADNDIGGDQNNTEISPEKNVYGESDVVEDNLGNGNDIIDDCELINKSSACESESTPCGSSSDIDASDENKLRAGSVQSEIDFDKHKPIGTPSDCDKTLTAKGGEISKKGDTNNSDPASLEITGEGPESNCNKFDKESEHTTDTMNDHKREMDMNSTNSTPGNDSEINTKNIASLANNSVNENFKSDQLVTNEKEKQSQELNNYASPETENNNISDCKVNPESNTQREDLTNKNTGYSVSSNNRVLDATDIQDVTKENVQNGEIDWTDAVKENDQKQEYYENLEDNSKYIDSECLDENSTSKNNIEKPYMDGIRRLSMGIVKDVIESAKSSVNEILTNKSEELTEEPLDYSSNNNEVDHNGAIHLGNCDKNNLPEKTNTSEDVESKLDEKYSLENNSTENNDLNYIENMASILDSDTVCGYGCFKPPWIQQYSRPKVFLTLFSIIGVIHGIYYPYFISIITTLEKRYAFETKVSGTLLMADEITPLILGVIVGYIGSKTHRPRMVALGMFMSVACCFISGLPYLIYGPSKHLSSIKYKNETGPELCDVEATGDLCDVEDLPPTMTVVGIFLIASFLKGFATLSYYIIGISYMDDNIKKKNSPLYLAIALALRLLGPLVGFLMSSIFLKFYEDPSDDPGYGPDDPRWVGAWWIGFFLQGIVLFIFTLPIALFPRRLPGQGRVEKCTTTKDESSSMKEVLMGLLAALKRLGTNPVFVLLIINTNMKIFGHFGHSIMLPKYMENQFRLSAAEASLYSGATSVTFIMLSTIFGGYLIWKFRPRLKLLLGGMIISEIILCVGLLILMIPRCQIVEMMNFGLVDEGLVLNNTCNKMCDCTTTSYTPLCGSDGVTYFSPCFAGCKPDFITSVTSSKQKEYINCSCATTSAEEHSILSEGVCPDENCWSQALMYLIIYFILITMVNSFTVAHSMILLRSVHPKDKSMALGTFETFICLFGFIPFPVVFGALVDSACLVWEKSCGETGNCWFYDMHRYSYLMHGVGALFCFFSTLCLTGLYFLSSRVRDLYADEDEEKEYDDIKLDTVSGSVTKL